jgi:hypothetical protein
MSTADAGELGRRWERERDCAERIREWMCSFLRRGGE